MTVNVILILAIFIIAVLYSSVGHGGASGYIAIMVFFSIPIGQVKVYALVLNIIVSGIALFSYYRAGHFRARLLLPFVITSIPMAYWGGTIAINPHVLHICIGIALIIAAIQMVWKAGWHINKDVSGVKYYVALPVGALLGFVSGILGIGGGILLSPILILSGWANPKTTAATSAAFILLNSLSGLSGQLDISGKINPNFVILCAMAVAGGFIGSNLGSKKFSAYRLKVLLSIVLSLASLKLFLA